jgi:hypothetical protein
MLRDFYFEETHHDHIFDFCRQFVRDEAYRAACLSGEVDWAIRNPLFEINVGHGTLHPDEPHSVLSHPQKVYNFFKKHWERIVNLPEYQRLVELDSQFNPTSDKLDPEIRPAVEAFNRIEGVETLFSCQGISGTVWYERMSIRAVTPHERLAYISFRKMPEVVEERLIALLSPYTAYRREPWWNRTCLRSTGDNVAFREEALRIALRLGFAQA